VNAVSPWQLAVVFGRISSTAFGGGQIPAIRREIVRRNAWLTEPEFLELLGIAQIAPGPNPVNMAVLIGGRLAGPFGACVALLACTLPGFLILLAIAAVALDPRMAFLRAGLRGCAAAAVGLTLANAIEMTLPYRTKLLELGFVAAAALAVIVLHVSLELTLLLLVPLSIALVRRKPA
jgi:chromate transporter